MLTYKDIEHLHKGNKVKYKSVGIPELDNHIVFKKNFSIIGGISNVGKTTAWLYVLFIWALRHEDNLKFLLMLNENEYDDVSSMMISWYTGMEIDDLPEHRVEQAINWINQHFKIMRKEEIKESLGTRRSLNNVLNYAWMVKNGERNITKFDFDGFFIDPYNAIRTRGYDAHYDNATSARNAVETLDAKVMISMHVATAGQRNRDEDGIVKCPHIADLEFGSMWQNRADDNVTVHRHIQSKQLRHITEIHVQKIKHIKSGGMPTYVDEPITLIYKESVGGRFMFPNSGDAIDTPIEDISEVEFKQTEIKTD